MARPRSGVCAEADADERESSKVVKIRLVGLARGAPAAAATVPTGFGSPGPPLYFNFKLNFARLLVSESLTRPPGKVKFRS